MDGYCNRNASGKMNQIKGRDTRVPGCWGTVQNILTLKYMCLKGSGIMGTPFQCLITGMSPEF